MTQQYVPTDVATYNMLKQLLLPPPLMSRRWVHVGRRVNKDVINNKSILNSCTVLSHCLRNIFLCI